MNRIRIVIADDHPIFSRGLRQVLTADPVLDVVAEARDGKAAFESIRQHQPDVAILDVDMPQMDGFEVVRAMEEHKLWSAVIFLTMHKNEALFHGAMDLGVRGYVLKDSALSEAVDSVRAVAAGNTFVSPLLASYFIDKRRRAQDLRKQQPGLEALTPAEQRVLQLIAAGKRTADIAAELYLSIRTVEHHRAHICSKLNLQGRDALLRFAITHKSELS
jgi:two-component system, NarL family, response regulator DegU